MRDDGIESEEVLSIDTREGEDEVTMVLRGEIDSLTAPLLRDALEPYVQHSARLVLDLAGIDFIDSSGLRIIVNAHKACQGRLWLRGLSPTSERLLDITGLRPHLQVSS